MLSHTAAPAVAAFLTPRLSTRYSWQTVCYIFAASGAVFGAVWQLGVTSKPPTAIQNAATSSETAAAAAKSPQEKKKPFQWSMFKLPSVSKNDEFGIKNEELCITNEAFVFKSEDFRIQHERYCTQMMNVAGQGAGDVPHRV